MPYIQAGIAPLLASYIHRPGLPEPGRQGTAALRHFQSRWRPNPRLVARGSSE